MIASLCFVLVAVVCCEVQSVISFSHRKSNLTHNYSAQNWSENVGTSNNSGNGNHDRYSQDAIQLYSGPERFHSHNDGGQFGSKVKQSDFLHTTERSHIDSRPKSVHRAERDQDVSNGSSSSEEGFGKNEAIDPSRSMYFPSDERLTKPAEKKEKQPCQHRICEDVDNYPAEKIVEVISRSRELVGFFKNQPKPFAIDNRFGEDDDDTPCPTMKTKKFPKRALSTRNVEQLIVNVNDFQQGVDLEICKKCCFYQNPRNMLKYPSAILLLIACIEFFSQYGQTNAYQFYKNRHKRCEESKNPAMMKELQDCDGGSCQVVSDYPQDKIEQALKKSVMLTQYFAARGQPDIEPRSGAPGKSLCSVHTQTYFYKKLNNTKGSEMFIVNHGEYKQGIALETCAGDTGTCSSGDKLFDEKSKCEQKYSSRILLAIGKGSEEVQFDTFKFPSCCVCLLV